MAQGRLIFLAVLAVFSLVSFPALAEGPGIEAFGDHSLWVLVNDLKDGFEKDTGVALKLLPELAVKSKGCAKGILHAYSGKPDRDVGLVCCGLNERIVKDYGLVTYPVAREPLAIIVNKDNPVSGLTLDEARLIFAGRITNWKEVGGRDEKIVVVTRLHCPEHTANWTKILSVPGKFAGKKLDVGSEPEMARTVSDYRQAIGHLEMTSVVGQRGLKALSIDGHKPTMENIESGLYPLWGTLSVVTKGEAAGGAMRFIEYLKTSPRAHSAMKKYGMAQTK